MDASIPQNFHPAIARWFVREYRQPTEVQSQAWEAIVEKKHTLIAAPTGSGKTLAGFLAIVNDLVIEGLERGLPQETRIVYVSPLKALSNDIEKNLQRPLQAIQDELESLRLPRVEIRVQVRTGDTPAGERTAMLKSPPHILVTTPESLYVLLTSDGGRKMLQSARIAIVDEIHALVGSKRGSHLALSLERLQSLVSRPLTRIGISATQKPLTQVADFLTGRLEPGAAPCTIIDVGHRRAMDLGIEIPRSPLGAVMEGEVWDEIYERLVELISEHRTTLIFVNTRRLA
ncbi:MAG TPA: DEAD/DEAH box helicase, partial [bacterium]|nr:DEAD/DEAH box helicase [bacterium]